MDRARDDRRVRRIGAAVAGAVLFAIQACANAAHGEPRLGGTWTVVSIDGRAITEALLAPRIQFTADGILQGATNCTEFRARFRIDGDDLDIGEFEVVARSGCTAVDQEIDAAFDRALTATQTVDGGLPRDRLILSGPGGERPTGMYVKTGFRNIPARGSAVFVFAQPMAQPDP